ncbi:MAG: rhodanese-like domain-containing protein [Gammaproteobacteria bacterium]|jgi:rhodanese-related sulfurtransferase|nr:rhodanese-like domain-containing protein [Gammaproteobacteria bacterium]MDP6617228.1 rhodanese-like domain-containing protein [Gammaproteobacteria bacterium]MDP6695815.1 rhodanese-like domain-containing protein [Gammaproteobacteria bacterium]
MKLKLGFMDLVARAESEIQALSPAEVDARIGEDGVLLVDLRDIRELKREGKIPGSVHIPRGMLEFWIDPDSPYYKEYFDDAREVIFYCNKGWRSALATQAVQNMGAENVLHMAGGFENWVEDIGRVEKTEK